MNTALEFPRRRQGRQSAAAEASYQTKLEAFCEAIIELRSTIGFEISSRGWCYILEEHGLRKGDFDKAQSLIVECRKVGLLFGVEY